LKFPNKSNSWKVQFMNKFLNSFFVVLQISFFLLEIQAFANENLSNEEVKSIITFYSLQENKQLSSFSCKLNDGRSLYTLQVQDEKLFFSYVDFDTDNLSEKLSNTSEYLEVVFNTSDNNIFLRSYFDKDQVNFRGHCLKELPSFPFLGILPSIFREPRYRLLSEVLKDASVSGRIGEHIRGKRQIILEGIFNESIRLTVSFIQENEGLYIINRLLFTDDAAVPGGYYYWEYVPEKFHEVNPNLPLKYHVNLRTQPGNLSTQNVFQPLKSSEFREVIVTLNYDVLYEMEQQAIPTKFSRSIPNGSLVHMQDAPHIEHVWFNGRIVPKTDEVALRIARGDYGFMPGPKNPRFWFMALGLGMLLLGAGLKIRSMLKAT